MLCKKQELIFRASNFVIKCSTLLDCCDPMILMLQVSYTVIQKDRNKMSDEKPAFPEAKQDGMQFMVDILHKLGTHRQ